MIDYKCFSSHFCNKQWTFLFRHSPGDSEPDLALHLAGEALEAEDRSCQSCGTEPRRLDHRNFGNQDLRPKCLRMVQHLVGGLLDPQCRDGQK